MYRLLTCNTGRSESNGKDRCQQDKNYEYISPKLLPLPSKIHTIICEDIIYVSYSCKDPQDNNRHY